MLIQSMLKRKGSDVVTISPDARISDAVDALAKHRIGALVVSENGKTISGILSERDVVRKLAEQGTDTTNLLVSELMTTDVHTCGPRTSISELMELMTENRIRHVPVEINGELNGLVSIGDVVQARLHELEDERRHIEEYITT